MTKTKSSLLFLGALAGCLVVMLLSMLYGSQQLSTQEVLNTLTRQPTTSDVESVVWGLRAPRTVLGVIAGSLLGIAGALTQIHTRNPLADPGLIGVTSGASFAVIAGMAFGSFTSLWSQATLAVIGALACGTVVIFLSQKLTLFNPVTTLILCGAVTSALLGALTTAILLTHEDVMRRFQVWSTGTLVNRQLDILPVLVPLLVLGIILMTFNLSALADLELGDAVAAALGRNVPLHRSLGIGAIVVLAAVATAAVGPIGFVGLLAPHIARLFFRQNLALVVLFSAPVGIILLLSADVLGRVIIPSGELPVGIALALIGAPAFIVIARRVRS